MANEVKKVSKKDLKSISEILNELAYLCDVKKIDIKVYYNTETNTHFDQKAEFSIKITDESENLVDLILATLSESGYEIRYTRDSIKGNYLTVVTDNQNASEMFSKIYGLITYAYERTQNNLTTNRFANYRSAIPDDLNILRTIATIVPQKDKSMVQVSYRKKGNTYIYSFTTNIPECIKILSNQEMIISNIDEENIRCSFSTSNKRKGYKKLERVLHKVNDLNNLEDAEFETLLSIVNAYFSKRTYNELTNINVYGMYDGTIKRVVTIHNNEAVKTTVYYHDDQYFDKKILPKLIDYLSQEIASGEFIEALNDYAGFIYSKEYRVFLINMPKKMFANKINKQKGKRFNYVTTHRS